MQSTFVAALASRGVTVKFTGNSLVIGLADQSEEVRRMPRTAREKEHHKVAASFRGKPFSTLEFKARYRDMFPDRVPTSILPADFCAGTASSTGNAQFLRRLADGRYQFIRDADIIPRRLL